MNITDLIKQLNDLKKLHGNVDVVLINDETGYTEDIRVWARPIHSITSAATTKPATAVILCPWKA